MSVEPGLRRLADAPSHGRRIASYDPPIARCTYHLTRRSRAPREFLWALLADGRTWKDWAGVRRSILEREGAGDPNGVGSIRRLGYPPLAGSREQVVAHEPPSHLGYVILTGMLPVRNYRSDLRLEETSDGGTVITWQGSFDPIVPGTERIMETAIRKTLERFARLAARHAERQAGLPAKT